MRIRAVITFTTDLEVSDDLEMREHLYDTRDLSEMIKIVREEIKTQFEDVGVSMPDGWTKASKIEVNVWQRPRETANDLEIQDVTRRKHDE